MPKTRTTILLLGATTGLMTAAGAQPKTEARTPGAAIDALETGKKAPAFSLEDQFGTAQTLKTLKGKNGTILLFFRSADW